MSTEAGGETREVGERSLHLWRPGVAVLGAVMFVLGVVMAVAAADALLRSVATAVAGLGGASAYASLVAHKDRLAAGAPDLVRIRRAGSGGRLAAYVVALAFGSISIGHWAETGFEPVLVVLIVGSLLLAAGAARTGVWRSGSTLVVRSWLRTRRYDRGEPTRFGTAPSSGWLTLGGPGAFVRVLTVEDPARTRAHEFTVGRVSKVRRLAADLDEWNGTPRRSR